MLPNEYLDTPIWGAAEIAKAIGLFDKDGKPNIRKAFYLLEKGYVPGTKVGAQWTTTRRRLRDHFAGNGSQS